ncbi:MAG TPA: hypothetical protein VLG46_01735 [Anaerolineae bacterium]|nr:hypothetical protein [Anaerolineae bacterium]
MQEPSTTAPVSFTRKVRPPADIAFTTALTMTVVFLISEFSVETGVAIGSFAGFCVAAWNWFRMGRWRKALVHLVLGLGVYLLFYLCYALLAILLWRLLSPAAVMDVEVSVPGFSSAADTALNPQIKVLIQITWLLFSLGFGALVVTYLYKATLRDVQKVEPGSDLVEIYNFLPLLAIAVISVIFVMAASTVFVQARTAQMQSRVYCELLRPGMTFEEVESALNEMGDHYQAWFQDVPYPALSEKASYYRVVYWRSSRLEVNYDLSLQLGYDGSNRLVWKGRYWYDHNKKPHEEGVDTIACPWTFSQSVTAR